MIVKSKKYYSESSTPTQSEEKGLADVNACVVPVDDAISIVYEKRDEWKKLDLSVKIQLLDQCSKRLSEVRRSYHKISLERRNYTLKKHPTYKDAVIAEEALAPLTSDFPLFSWMKELRYMLQTLMTTKQFPRPTGIELAQDNTNVFVKLPYASGFIKFVMGVELECHVSSTNNLVSKIKTNTLSPEILSQIQYDGSDYFTVFGGVSVIMGAGNYDSPLDLLTALFIRNTVAVYKVHPLSINMLTTFNYVFKPFLERNYLVFCQGDLLASKNLLYDERVTHWFMTGSSKTAYNLLYGTDSSPFPASQKTASIEEIRSKLIKKSPTEFVLELGNVSPWIIAPEAWSHSDIVAQAKHLAFAMLYNGGHICVHPQVIITCENWKHREEFFTELRKQVEKSIFLGQFYPCFDRIKSKLEEENLLNESTQWKNGQVILVRNCPVSSWFLKNEAFCSISVEIALDTKESLDEYLPKAFDFSNNFLKGSLGATVIMKKSYKDPKIREYLATLKYGCVSINLWSMCSALFPQVIWGGHSTCGSLTHLNSGIGFFGNCFGLRHPLKSITASPFHGNMHRILTPPTKQSITKLNKTIERMTASVCRSASSPAATVIDGLGLLSATLFGI